MAAKETDDWYAFNNIADNKELKNNEYYLVEE